MAIPYTCLENRYSKSFFEKFTILTTTQIR